MRRSLWPVVLVGGAIGALNLAHYFVTAQVDGVGTPFGIFPGGFPIAAMLSLRGEGLSTDLVIMVVLGLGILVGALLSALHAGDLSIAKRLPRAKALRAAAGGILMGAGTWMAQGCLVKHTLSGAPGLMLSSFVTFTGIVLGVWASAWLAERAA